MVSNIHGTWYRVNLIQGKWKLPWSHFKTPWLWIDNMAPKIVARSPHRGLWGVPAISVTTQVPSLFHSLFQLLLISVSSITVASPVPCKWYGYFMSQLSSQGCVPASFIMITDSFCHSWFVPKRCPDRFPGIKYCRCHSLFRRLYQSWQRNIDLVEFAVLSAPGLWNINSMEAIMLDAGLLNWIVSQIKTVSWFLVFHLINQPGFACDSTVYHKSEFMIPRIWSSDALRLPVA